MGLNRHQGCLWDVGRNSFRLNKWQYEQLFVLGRAAGWVLVSLTGGFAQLHGGSQESQQCPGAVASPHCPHCPLPLCRTVQGHFCPFCPPGFVKGTSLVRLQECPGTCVCCLLLLRGSRGEGIKNSRQPLLSRAVRLLFVLLPANCFAIASLVRVHLYY